MHPEIVNEQLDRSVPCLPLDKPEEDDELVASDRMTSLKDQFYSPEGRNSSDHSSVIGVVRGLWNDGVIVLTRPVSNEISMLAEDQLISEADKVIILSGLSQQLICISDLLGYQVSSVNRSSLNHFDHLESYTMPFVDAM